MRVEVVRDVAGSPRPAREGVELRLGLRHRALEETERAELRPGAIARVRVDRVEALVVLDRDENAVPLRRLRELQVVLQPLHHGLGAQHVQTRLDTRERDLVLRVVRGEDGHDVALVHELDRLAERLRVERDVVRGQRAHREVHVLVRGADLRRHRLAHRGHARADGVHENHLADQPPPAHVRERDRHDAGGLIRGGARGGEHAPREGRDGRGGWEGVPQGRVGSGGGERETRRFPPTTRSKTVDGGGARRAPTRGRASARVARARRRGGRRLALAHPVVLPGADHEGVDRHRVRSRPAVRLPRAARNIARGSARSAPAGPSGTGRPPAPLVSPDLRSSVRTGV